ncbi:hypothetical protein O9X98_05975 [Agrobacterium salinitolerans]|nr:hypothetical protein [Agrobacterium salinitolerans]
MKAEFVIHYTAHSVAHGNRRFAETVTLDFREPFDDVAPIALEWEYGATRWFEGEHYRRMETPFKADMPIAEKEAALSKYFTVDGAIAHSSIRPYVDTGSLSSDRKFSERRHPDVTHDFGRLQALEKAEALVRDCIVVDGTVWLRCGEPRLVFHPATRYTAAHLEIDTTHRSMDTDRYRFGRFVARPIPKTAAYSTRIDTVENLQPIMAQWAIVPEPPEFTLHIPESINRNEFPAMIREAAEGIVCEMRSGQLSDKTGETAKRWITAIENYLDDNEDIDPEQVADYMARVAAELPITDRARKDLLTTVLKRWEDRPIGTDLAMNPTPTVGV